MRGKLFCSVICRSARGITPAGAGKTSTRSNEILALRDHPRRCGENMLSRLKTAVQTGSPPQVRGKLFQILSPIIRTKDHPRRCGENPYLQTVMMSGKGSPPQVRGKLPFASYVIFSQGITPAGAGKTRIFGKKELPIEDHPRRCGENRVTSPMQRGEKGSPPQVRGKH